MSTASASWGWAGDVTHLFNTHLHFDHCGQNFLFTDVPILVHKAHYEAALTGPAFPNENFDLPDLHYELFEGDLVELFPGVTTLTTHGHAPHHQSLLIELPNSGPILLAGSMRSTPVSISSGVPGGRRPIRTRRQGRWRDARRVGARPRRPARLRPRPAAVDRAAARPGRGSYD